MAEQMQDPIVSLIWHYAGSSATPIVLASQLGWKADYTRVQGCLHMRILTPKKMGESGNVTKVMEKRGPGWRGERWWHGKVTSEMDLKGWEVSGGLEGMHKKGQMVPLGVGWLTGVFTEVTVGWVQISIVTTLLSHLAPASMGALLT